MTFFFFFFLVDEGLSEICEDLSVTFWLFYAQCRMIYLWTKLDFFYFRPAVWVQHQEKRYSQT